MQFQTPQFIEVEDKIFGPLTFKQFVYLAGGAGLIVALWSFLPGFVAFILSVPVIVLSLALAFYRINNKPFINIMEAFFNYTRSSKLYIWQKEEKKAVAKKQEIGDDLSLLVPHISDSKLKDLTWSLGVKENEKTPVSTNKVGLPDTLLRNIKSTTSQQADGVYPSA